MRALLSLSWAIALSIGLAIGACSYDPKFADGTLECSVGAGACPDGYSCNVATNRCVSRKEGTTGVDGGGGGSDVGLGGDNVPAAVRNRYIGTWLLGPTSMVVTRCAGGPPGTGFLSPAGNESYMTIRDGIPGQSDLESDWLCDNVGLRVDGAGAAHLYDSAPTCSRPGTQPSVTMQTWTITQFEITNNNGTTASHTAHYLRVDTSMDGTSVNCAQDVTASLIKQP